MRENPKYEILICILINLFESKNHLNHLKLIVKKQPNLINMSMGVDAPSMLHLAVYFLNVDAISFLIELELISINKLN